MSPARMAKMEAAMRAVLEFNEARNCRDVEDMMRLVGDGCILESASPAPGGTVYSGKEEVARFWRDFFRESPGAGIEIEDIFGLGERCVMRWRLVRTDAGDRGESVRGVDLFRVRGGLIREQLSYIKG